jgi:hypothetical protein
VSTELNAVLLKALAKEPELRFQNAQEFMSAIEAARSQQPVAQKRVTLKETFTRPGKREGHAPTLKETGPALKDADPGRPAPDRRPSMSILIGALAALSAGAMLFIATTEYRRSRPAVVDPSSTRQEGQPAANKETIQLAKPETGSASNLTGGGPGVKPAQTTSVPGSVAVPPRPGLAGGGVLPPKLVSANPQAMGQNQDVPPDLQERFVDLQARAASANSSWSAIREQNAKEGLGLRADVSQGLARMNLHLEQASAALRSGDATAARRNMDSLEGDLKSLDKAAGR